MNLRISTEALDFTDAASGDLLMDENDLRLGYSKQTSNHILELECALAPVKLMSPSTEKMNVV